MTSQICLTTVVNTDLASYTSLLQFLISVKYSLKFNLRASNFQYFPGGMPPDLPIRKACFVLV